MRWEGDRESGNREDCQHNGSRGFGIGLGSGVLGLGGIVLVLAAVYFLGINPLALLDLLPGSTERDAPLPQISAQNSPVDDQLRKFVSTILADTEDAWIELFRAGGADYVKPTLALFSDRILTACGNGEAATGPFYCPGDQKVYIDLGFYRLMRQRFHVSSDFAQAYVIAHEVGHHVQNLMGISGKLDSMRRRMSAAQVDALSVRLELQADCFAGVWAHHAKHVRDILKAGDMEAALNAASAIGDAAIQRQAPGEAVPDSFTHGTSAQRVRWFRRGIENGRIKDCNTFDARRL